jgi:hypothetical protein
MLYSLILELLRRQEKRLNVRNYVVDFRGFSSCLYEQISTNFLEEKQTEYKHTLEEEL